MFYAKSSKEQVHMMHEICSKQGLLMTGGSDFHGPGRTGRCQRGEFNTDSRFKLQELFGQLSNISNEHIRQQILA
ncbi:hypothetical protein [Methanolobus sp.]|uniref:hypothetical protein n=1 Tax=Methanolobus sp. TaxID=1874737 RepID=UPI0025CFF268|nr:hypothetical protein [Methanolobus sp.]